MNFHFSVFIFSVLRKHFSFFIFPGPLRRRAAGRGTVPGPRGLQVGEPLLAQGPRRLTEPTQFDTRPCVRVYIYFSSRERGRRSRVSNNGHRRGRKEREELYLCGVRRPRVGRAFAGRARVSGLYRKPHLHTPAHTGRLESAQLLPARRQRALARSSARSHTSRHRIIIISREREREARTQFGHL